MLSRVACFSIPEGEFARSRLRLAGDLERFAAKHLDQVVAVLRQAAGEWIVILSAIFLHLNKTPITDLTSTTFTYMPKISLYPRENKPNFAGVATTGMGLSMSPLSGIRSVTTRGWVGQRSRPWRGRTCPKARPVVAGARRCGAGLRWRFRGGPESCVSLLAS